MADDPRRGQGPVPKGLLERWQVLAVQLAVVAVLLTAWELLPKVTFLSERFPVFDPFFVSSPSRVWDTLLDLFTGREGTSIGSYAWSTLSAFAVGTTVGVVGGVVAGLGLSSSPRGNQILRPMIVAVNAIPRVALVPIFVIIWGPTFEASVVTCVTVVFFVVFFNAYEGARTVPVELIQNARLLGAARFHVLRSIRFPHAAAWTFAALPNAVTYGLIAVVTAELLTGHTGLGRLLLVSVTAVNSSLTFAVVVVLGALGVLLVGATEYVKARALRWSEQG